MGFSFDWSKKYQTISDQSVKLSQLSFIDLYEKKLVELRFGPTFWDPVDLTAISQAEMEDKERLGHFLYIKFQITSGDEIIIATTRPEMLSACVAIFYNPEDPRYNKVLRGKTAIVPIFNQEVPLLESIDVDIEKGSGIVMCCTFGDIQDIKWQRDFDLPIKQVIDKSGKMIQSNALNGMTVLEARRFISDMLKAQHLITASQEINQSIKCAERSGAVLEIIPTKQWYIKLLDNKEEFLQQSAKCNWHPIHMKQRLDNWILGLNQDWCISRQRYFGVQFPIWYSKRKGEEGKIIVAEKEDLPVNPEINLPKGYLADEVECDVSVMDTWATSAITPQLSSFGINNELAFDANRHAKLFPADLRPQAHEIIRTWTFSSIVKAFYHQNSIPWKNIMISGWCLTADKNKMSKSKGNAKDPRDLIEQQGADVLRYWASNSKLGADIIYSEDAMQNGKRLLNKLWNVGKFFKLHKDNLEGSKSHLSSSQLATVNAILSKKLTLKHLLQENIIYEELDIWVLSEMQLVIQYVTGAFEKFEYSDARTRVEEFFWKIFCDDYIELVKKRLYLDEHSNQYGPEILDNNHKDTKENDCNDFFAKKISAFATITHVFEVVLILFAPFIPYITEELFQNVLGNRKSVHSRCMWPDTAILLKDQNTMKQGSEARQLLNDVRKQKSILGVSVGKVIPEIRIKTQYLSRSSLRDLGCAMGASILKVETNADKTFVEQIAI